jgi:putative endonuclease
MFYVYVLKSSVDGRLYKGFTKNLELRVKQHNQGKVRSTKGYRTWKLVYFETFNVLAEARQRELYFKSGEGREFLQKQLAP